MTDIRQVARETAKDAEIERLRKDNLHWEHQNGLLEAEIERMQSLLFRLRNYIAGERTSDRPKDAMLELIDAALEPKP